MYFAKVKKEKRPESFTLTYIFDVVEQNIFRKLETQHMRQIFGTIISIPVLGNADHHVL